MSDRTRRIFSPRNFTIVGVLAAFTTAAAAAYRRRSSRDSLFS